MLKRILSLLLCLSVLLLCGCSRSTTAEPHNDSNEIISEAVPEESADPLSAFGLAYQEEYGLDPFDCTSLNNRTILSLLYESLFTVTSGFEAEPLLCETFDVSEDLKEYTIHLVPGVQFCDGTPLTASDVAASYRAAKDSEYYGKRFYALASVDAPSADTVVFRMTMPYENLALLLDVPIVNAASIGTETLLGTGPYRLIDDRHTSSLARNGYWWRNSYDGVVNVDSIRLVPTKNPTDVRDDFEYGVTGVVCTDPNAAAYVDYHCDYELWNCPSTIMDYIGFNVKTGLFCLTELRVTLTNIIDRETIATELYRGYAEAAVLPVSPLSPFYDTKLAEQYDYEPNKFMQAVTATKAKSSEATFLVCNTDPRRVEAAEFIAAEAEKYGIILKVDAVNEQVYKNRLFGGNFDLYFGQARLSPTFDLSPFFNGGALCYGGLYSGDFSDQCYAALKNSGNYVKLHTSILTLGMLCPVVFRSYAVYATRGTINNMYPALDNVFHSANGRSLSDAIKTAEDAKPDEQNPDDENPDEKTPDDENPDEQNPDGETTGEEPPVEEPPADTEPPAA